MTIVHWLLANWVGLLVVILSFGFIIFIHELGHFIMAKRVGVKVHEFALGFGPCLFSRKRGETEYALRLFPVGGYVRMEGEDTPCDNPEDTGNFQNKTVWERVKIVASGPLMNYITALFIFLTVGLVYGVGEIYLKPKVGKILEGSPAQKIGLEPGDYIVAINGQKVKDAYEMIDTIHKNPEKEISIEIERGEGPSKMTFTRTVTTILMPGTKEKIGIIGFSPDTKAIDMRFERKPFGTVITDSVDQMARFTVAPFYAFYLIFKGKMKAKEVTEGSAGPVGIGQMFFEMYRKGFSFLLYFLGMINVLIGCFNLIPFPALDGSRVLILIISGIRNKPFNQEKEGYVHLVGFIILIMVVLFFTYNDIIRIIQGVSFFK
ncbi:MAG: M50 family metallopeptidase [Candidatus Eremiobacteraeota bacterium]|nr:M50 family metallopeptidase [Candidatus Eremiobacteraeota bacterium]